jgi:hypothetical protein
LPPGDRRSAANQPARINGFRTEAAEDRMADARRNEKPAKKDQRSPREISQEINEEIQSGTIKPKQEHPNRNRARGDWDRTGDHYDQGTSRSEE